jgi:hypothetical protein
MCSLLICTEVGTEDDWFVGWFVDVLFVCSHVLVGWCCWVVCQSVSQSACHQVCASLGVFWLFASLSVSIFKKQQWGVFFRTNNDASVWTVWLWLQLPPSRPQRTQLKHTNTPTCSGKCSLEHNQEFQRQIAAQVSSSKRPIQMSLQEQVLVVASSVNVRPEQCLAVNCRKGFYDPAHQPSRHIGLHPHILDAFVHNRKFAAWLNRFLEDFLVTTESDRLERLPEPFSRGLYHIGCWCNNGPTVSSSQKG